MQRQMPGTMNVQRRVDGNLVFGTVNEISNVPDQVTDDRTVTTMSNASDNEIAPEAFGDAPAEVPDFASAVEDLPAMNKVAETELSTQEPSLIDSYFGDGMQSRILESLNNWVVDKAKANPGCVERFICETYRTGETLEGIPYFLVSLTK